MNAVTSTLDARRAKAEGKEAAMQRVFELYVKYVYRGQDPLGPMDVKRLAGLQEFYLKQGIIERATPVDQLYTDQFVR